MIFTIGHSNHSIEEFLALLGRHKITALADVRSAPYSRWARQFNKDALTAALADANIAYVYLGAELGGRPKDAALQENGKPNYAAMAQTETFRTGIGRVLEGAKSYTIALMCAERDPTDCHRFHLISRELAARGVAISHILPSGDVEGQTQTQQRLGEINAHPDLFDR